MQIAFVNPFLVAAYSVLEAEVGEIAKRGVPKLESTHYTTQDVTVLLGVTGEVEGVVLYGISEAAAIQLTETMVGQKQLLFDELAQSAIQELGNMITGRATIELEKAGFQCTLTPPTLLIGRGSILSTRAIERVAVPIEINAGTLEISLALQMSESRAMHP